MANLSAMRTAYFISDVHLGAQDPEREREKADLLQSFLDRVETGGGMLYIVGDLFDYWFEYRWALPKVNLRLLCKLHRLVEAGGEVVYLSGNHDLWLSRHVPDQLGLRLEHGPLTVTHEGLRLLLIHGDGLIRQDRRMRWLNRVFRNRVNIALYRWLHPDVGLPLMRWVAAKSRQRGDNPYASQYRAFARARLEEGYDAVILGHTHLPVFEEVEGKYYINLGDWLQHRTFLEVRGTRFVLKTWPADCAYVPSTEKLVCAS